VTADLYAGRACYGANPACRDGYFLLPVPAVDRISIHSCLKLVPESLPAFAVRNCQPERLPASSVTTRPNYPAGGALSTTTPVGSSCMTPGWASSGG